MILIFLQVTYTLQDNNTITGDSSETVDVASILALNDLAEETTITVSNDEDIKEYEGNKSFSLVFCLLSYFYWHNITIESQMASCVNLFFFLQKSPKL